MCGAETGIVVEVHRVDRAETQRALKLLDRIFGLIRIIIDPSESTPSPCTVRVKSEGPLKQHASGSIVAYKGMNSAEDCQDKRIVAAQVRGLLRERSGHSLTVRDIIRPIVDGTLG